MTAAKSLAALIEAAPPELVEALTRPCPCEPYSATRELALCGRCYERQEHAIVHLSSCAVHNEPAYPNGPCDCGGLCQECAGAGRVSLPVPEATLAAMQWMQERDGSFSWNNGWIVYTGARSEGHGPDIFAAIRAALEAQEVGS